MAESKSPLFGIAPVLKRDARTEGSHGSERTRSPRLDHHPLLEPARVLAILSARADAAHATAGRPKEARSEWGEWHFDPNPRPRSQIAQASAGWIQWSSERSGNCSNPGARFQGAEAGALPSQRKGFTRGVEPLLRSTSWTFIKPQISSGMPSTQLSSLKRTKA